MMFREETAERVFIKTEEGNWVNVDDVQAVAVRPSGKTGIYLSSGIILTTDMTPQSIMERMAYVSDTYPKGRANDHQART